MRVSKLILVSITLSLPAFGGEPGDAGIQFFESKIRPLLADNCFSCHSVNAKKLKAKLYADSLQGLLKGGETGPALVPGQPEKSKMIEAVGYKNQDLQMPPESKLSDAQIADLTRWVKLGAPWPKEAPPVPKMESASKIEPFDLQKRKASHWAWQPVRAQTPPVCRTELPLRSASGTEIPIRSAPGTEQELRSTWIRDPLDAFVMKKLEDKNLKPAPLADKRTLLRRASFDLIGLPPTPEEIDAFLKDESPDAFAKVIDRLLASPHFGERWARHWLDLVRYAESRGHEFDFTIPNAYQYRDYVIRAFNADVPYNQFAIEHIAGDLLETPRVNPATGFNESVIGTAYFELGEDVQAPVDVRQHQADRFDNMIDVTGKTFLGMTVACARCHDHKFDAISSADYYALYGYLKSTRFTQAALNQRSINEKAAELLALKKQIAALACAELKEKAKSLGEALEHVKAPAKIDISNPLYVWAKMQNAPPEKLGEKWSELRAEVNANAAALRDKPAAAPHDREIALESFALSESLQLSGGCVLGGDAKRPVAEIRSGGWLASDLISRKLEGSASSPTFTLDKPFIHVLAKGHGARVSVIVDNFTLIRAPIYGDLRKHVESNALAWINFDVRMWQGHEAYIQIDDSATPVPGEEGVKPEATVAVRRVVLSERNAMPAGGADSELIAAMADYIANHEAPASLQELAANYQGAAESALEKMGDGFSEASLIDAALMNTLIENGLLELQPSVVLQELLKKYYALATALPAPVRSPAMTDGTGADECVFIRGSNKTLGARVPRRFLVAISGENQPAPKAGSGRLELARRIADSSNPLFARVMVNRLWHHLFGRGIVASTDNFGKLGEEPTHPELLDFLADRFVKDGWSVKTALRKMMLSSAYQMSSAPNPANNAKLDPDNKFLAHQRIKRLEGEAIRDAMLAISGRLDPAMFGPSIDVHLTPFMEGRGRPNGGPLDGAGRRSIYTAVRRNFLPPMMLAFDTPAPFSAMGRRTVSNVPAQALILMNDPFVAQQAELWSKRVLADKNAAPAQRIARMYVAAFAREPSEIEAQDALDFIDAQTKESNDAQAWKEFAHVLMNVKEFVFVR
ncbi:MAG TPA: PSD1 and planctomycete cytochrome C domain-containing protein [Planctomycetota bacterium]|nr:PSD1 and planctomycete cytochrome C domain-containing protein [Planctomycetota bacterium]